MERVKSRATGNHCWSTVLWLRMGDKFLKSSAGIKSQHVQYELKTIWMNIRAFRMPCLRQHWTWDMNIFVLSLNSTYWTNLNSVVLRCVIFKTSGSLEPEGYSFLYYFGSPLVWKPITASDLWAHYLSSRFINITCGQRGLYLSLWFQRAF